MMGTAFIFFVFAVAAAFVGHADVASASMLGSCILFFLSLFFSIVEALRRRRHWHIVD
jgi:uncharacterized membrane protein YtjA (UPF0391 family)